MHQQFGFEQRWATRLARLAIVALEKSSRAIDFLRDVGRDRSTPFKDRILLGKYV
jgi:hypothetical protein